MSSLTKFQFVLFLCFGFWVALYFAACINSIILQFIHANEIFLHKALRNSTRTAPQQQFYLTNLPACLLQSAALHRIVYSAVADGGGEPSCVVRQQSPGSFPFGKIVPFFAPPPPPEGERGGSAQCITSRENICFA